MLDKVAGKEYCERYKNTEVAEFIRDNIKNVFDIDHIIPISCNGIDHECNRHQTRRPLHNYKHRYLDFPTKEFSARMRRIRKLYNHKLVKSPKELGLYYQMQKRFFSNLYNLEQEVISIHENKIIEIVNYWENNAKRMTDYGINTTSVHDFHEGLEMQHMLQIRIANKIKEELSRKFYIG